MASTSLLRILLIVSAALVLLIYFLYPTSSFPFGLEALECLVSFIVLIASILLLTKLQTKISGELDKRSMSLGFYIGLLWTIEISINNFIRPGLPLRDIIDDIFWGLIACLILYLATVDAIKTKRISPGIKSGFLSGFSSGAVACLTALLLICFGMQLIVIDPLNISEWSAMNDTTHYPNMAIYFAYQTLTGAMLHLILLGAIMGLLLGVIGGIVGKLLSFIKYRNKLASN